MPRNTSASMFGSIRPRDSRASVASPQGLRNMLRNQTETDSAPVAVAAPVTAAAAPAPAAPPDDKQTLRGLNDRLSGYLNRVRQLQDENENLNKEIDAILAKRKAPEGRDWDKTGKPLDELKAKLNDITMDNGRLLIEIDNTKLATDDFKKKLEGVKKDRNELEKDLEDVKKSIEDTKLNCEQTNTEIDMVKDELDRLQQEHKNEVDIILEKIRESEVKVEIESQNSSLSDTIEKVRGQYNKLAKENLKETEEWYQNKFEGIKMKEAQNTEALQSGQEDLKCMSKERTALEIRINGLHTLIQNLEETLVNTKADYGQQLAPLNQMLLGLEAELKNIRSQQQQQSEKTKDLMCVKLKLEAEIAEYQKLISA